MSDRRPFRLLDAAGGTVIVTGTRAEASWDATS